MATAQKDAGADVVGLRDLPAASVRQLFEHERLAWLQRLHWDMRDAADVASQAVAARLLDGMALVRGSRLEGFVACQPSRAVSRLCGGWLGPRASDEDACRLVAGVLRRIPRSARAEGQIIAFEAQPRFDRAFASCGFVVEPRDYVVAPLPDAAPTALPAEFVPLDSARIRPCAELIVAAHRGGVESSINASFRAERGAHEYLTDILAGQGCGDVVQDGCLAALHDRRVVGFCLATLISGGVGHVPQIVVHPGLQGRGLGAALLGASAAVLRRHGAVRVTLSVSVRNARAAGWYARWGFLPATRFSAYHRDAA